MTYPAQRFPFRFNYSLPAPRFALALFCALTLATLQPAYAQSFSVLHTFMGSPDGAHPGNGVVIDQAAIFTASRSTGA